ncbi:MAG: L,D-transpeptidase family protein, partial [Chthoniobacteraceae bacterium]
ICIGTLSSQAQQAPAPTSAPGIPPAIATPAAPTPAPMPVITPLPTASSTATATPQATTTPQAATPAPTPVAASSASPQPTAGGAEPGVAKAEPVSEREIMTRLQIFLDQQLFGPGKIDGRGKLFTAQALDRYQKAHGLPMTATIDENIPLDSVYPVYTTYEIKKEDLKYVGELPSKPVDQAKKKYMPYPSLHEMISERYHTDPDFLVKINPGVNLEKLKPGDSVRVPNVAPFKIEDLVENPKLPVKPEFQSRVITVDTRNKMLDLTDGDKLIASFPITPGSETLPAPKGTWKILGICELPNFRHDEAMLMHGYRSKDFQMIPIGPRDPVGVMWMGLNKPGIGIHGTNSPWNIGRSGSHGCIRVANWDVIRLSAMVSEGMKVIIK